MAARTRSRSPGREKGGPEDRSEPTGGTARNEVDDQDLAEDVGRAAGDESDEEIGESASVSPTAPASSGLMHGSGGTIDPEVDLQPRDSQGAGSRPSGRGETPVRSPSGGAETGPHTRSGSAGAASMSAGSASPADAREGSEMEDRTPEKAED